MHISKMLFCKWSIFKQLRLQNESTTSILKLKSTGGVFLYVKQYFIYIFLFIKFPYNVPSDWLKQHALPEYITLFNDVNLAFKCRQI